MISISSQNADGLSCYNLWVDCKEIKFFKQFSKPEGGKWFKAGLQQISEYITSRHRSLKIGTVFEFIYLLDINITVSFIPLYVVYR